MLPLDGARRTLTRNLARTPNPNPSPNPDQVPQLLELSTQLRFTPRERELPSVPSLANASNDRDGAVQTLTEIFNLYN